MVREARNNKFDVCKPGGYEKVVLFFLLLISRSELMADAGIRKVVEGFEKLAGMFGGRKRFSSVA